MSVDFSPDLLAWYSANKRTLPWRRPNPDPYAVWISEIMLQQTTVAAVVGFYERWMARFPTVEELARAPLDEVLRYWAGLGYYARARNIKKAADVIVERGSCRFPANVDDLLKLPGVGRYTAGAIASIAFGVRAPILDANVTRVLSRLFAVAGDPKSQPAHKRLWQIAQDAMPQSNAGDFNQALMELGALVCLPSAPRCPSCPVASYCAARLGGDPSAYPELKTAKRWLDEHHCSAVLEAHGQVLLIRRPEEGLWGGLWELPRATAADGESWEDCAPRAVKEAVGLDACLTGMFGSIKHVVMNRKITLHGFSARPSGGDLQPIGCASFAWVSTGELPKYALSSPQRRLLSLWLQARQQPAFDLEEESPAASPSPARAKRGADRQTAHILADTRR